MSRDYDNSNRRKVKEYRLNFRAGEKEMSTIQTVMDGLYLNKTDAICYIIEQFEYAVKLIRDSNK